MGILSDVKAMRDVQRIKNGGTAMLSVASITTLIINLPDAKKNLPEDQFRAVYAMFGEFRKMTEKHKMDIERYYNVAAELIKVFNRIAPYELYSGADPIETKLLLDAINDM